MHDDSKSCCKKARIAHWKRSLYPKLPLSVVVAVSPPDSAELVPQAKPRTVGSTAPVAVMLPCRVALVWATGEAGTVVTRGNSGGLGWHHRSSTNPRPQRSSVRSQPRRLIVPRTRLIFIGDGRGERTGTKSILIDPCIPSTVGRKTEHRHHPYQLFLFS